MKKLATSLLVTLFFSFCVYAGQPLNVVVIGAHPDDADIRAGGTAIKYAKAGHNVLFVSLTNGDAGHHEKGGGALARIRRAEAQEAGKRFGVKYVVLDNHDGELMPTLENRFEVIRLIRKWNADIVMGPRPNDYHPDHRNTAIIVQDAAYMVIVPNVASDVPPLKKNPVFLYVEDRFQKPYPFQPDISVDISEEFNQKIYGIAAHESQMFEWLPWTNGKLDQVPDSEDARLELLKEWRKPSISEKVEQSLIKWYGKEKASKITAAEAFEICEYGRRPSDEELAKLFPFFD
ncbi:N-acetylglucosaminyl deacetylase, LmbE family [Mariniphaga anaerophila]|uniref:N-acetylglucosaminyl deacetylase, LmbE family n=1 Tax=Mariniphaga anaerophila TaxID=1484053 RepID=A0A1M5F6K3_9BACT|nr:PIG-L family deacetylase [Mariniphaga anaerophila]SHF87115.1 N-acetylglucosaminyl deacetylase, LmbE family [Mariniphaga anaerophila]